MEEKIIEFVRENTFLYDKRRELYKNTKLKERKWREFAEEMEVPAAALKKRWKSLKDCYNRTKKRMDISGSESPSAWKYYEIMRFLDGCPPVNSRILRNFERVDLKNFEMYSNSNETPTSYEETPYNYDDLIIEESENYDMFEEKHAVHRNSSSTPHINNEKIKQTKTKIEIDDARRNISEYLSNQSFTPAASTAESAFFSSIALQVEPENLSFERFASLQMKVLKAVREEVMGQREDNRNK